MLRPLAAAALLVLVASSAGAQGAGWNQAPRYGYRYRGHRGAHVRLAGDYTLREGETASGPIIVVGGTAEIDGHADDNVVVIGGSVRIGPTAIVDGDLVTFGGTSHIDPAARISGHVSRARITWPPTWRDQCSPSGSAAISTSIGPCPAGGSRVARPHTPASRPWPRSTSTSPR